MATTPVTTDVSTQSIPPSAIGSSPSTTPTETSSSAPAPESTSTSTESQPRAAVPHEQSQSSELNPQDFDSLEEFAQALIDKKQSAAASAAADSTSSTDEQRDEVTEGQTDAALQPSATEDLKSKAEDQTVDLEKTTNFISSEALTEKINANPALKQALEADAPLRDAILHNAELASEAAGFKELFPNVDSARYAAEQFAELAALDHAFLNASTKEAAQDFFGRWARLAVVTDAQGNIVHDQNGNPQMHGAWSTVNQHLFDSQLDFVRNYAERAGDHELMAALDVVREVFINPPGLRSPATVGRPAAAMPAMPGLPAATNDLPPHLRAAADSINRREQELAQQQLAQHERNIVAFESELSRQASDQLNALVRPIVEKAALPDFVRQTAQQKIESAIIAGLKNDRFFQSRLSEIERFPRTDETLRQRLNLIMTHAQAMAGPIARQVLREASQPVIKAQEDRRARIESQIARTRSEPKSVGGAVAPGSTKQTPEQLLTNAKEQLRDDLGEEPNMSQVIERFARLRKTSI